VEEEKKLSIALGRRGGKTKSSIGGGSKKNLGGGNKKAGKPPIGVIK